MLTGGKSFRKNGFKIRALPEDHEEHKNDSQDFRIEQSDDLKNDGQDDFMDKEFSKEGPQMMGSVDDLKPMGGDYNNIPQGIWDLT